MVTLDPPVITSSRRFWARGEALTTLSDVWLTFRYLRGDDENSLAKLRRGFSEKGMTYDDLHLKRWTLK